MASKKKYRAVTDYHERTKHGFQKLARSPGSLDWANQPDPFRRWLGSDQVELPLLENDPPDSYKALYTPQPDKQPEELSLASLGSLFELSLGLSAWKAVPGGRWVLRINPSSGNLHPTEAHLLLPVEGEPGPGVYHYDPLRHTIERRAALDSDIAESIIAHFGGKGFLVALTGIFWREAWKYGERAFRYCQHDTGHALAALRFSSGIHGWRMAYLGGLSDRQAETILGFGALGWERNEREYPGPVCFVSTGAGQSDIPRSLPEGLVSRIGAVEFGGRPTPISRRTVQWDAIFSAAEATRKGASDSGPDEPANVPVYRDFVSPIGAAKIIRKRRSAQAMSRERVMSRYQFLSMLDKTLPRAGTAPFDLGLGENCAHLVLFVHEVDGLGSGLYLLVRNSGHLGELRQSLSDEFAWEEVGDGLPLYRLADGDFRRQAMMLSCSQEIASDGNFAASMLCRFAPVLEKEPWLYRRLFWETGMVGQVLYLEAEAHGFRGTGIGCFFDDPVHEVLGIVDDTYQSLYHFTVGTPVEDSRIQTMSAYHHLRR